MKLDHVTGFDWDRGNCPKCGKHGVSQKEIEAIFLHPMMVGPDPYPLELERRFNAVGYNEAGRAVFVVFTLRQSEMGPLIRPVSARYLHRKEVERYERR